ncbi:ATP-binding protein [Dyadobacter sp. CY343]|uniref:sensor histidine kinase n=1 Tax=Dyadobacter sp. CY343 TaxID=2907299 RepID=UPI001F3681BA|nr:PAS domain-containing sensor histidine kinase [Dyadobacter sp. CY343]MCE7060291.1 ATP-binding protein [Dyadobacter sp. CY343]
MNDIIVFNLENDQDLVLAHRRSMQLCEMCGLGLIAQTGFATAVSEVARFMIENQTGSVLNLSLGKSKNSRPAICASINYPSLNRLNVSNENFQYARKLVSDFQISASAVSISCELPKTIKLSQALFDKCKQEFNKGQAISPYEEVKRKNAELQQLADILVASENRYQELTSSLPLMMFSLAPDHQMLYANQSFLDFTGRSLEDLKKTNWFEWVKTHHLDVDFGYLRTKLEDKKAFQLEVILSSAAGKVWHLLSLTPQLDSLSGNLLQWFGFIVDIHAQKVVDETLKDNQELRRVKEIMEIREKQLDDTIQELNRSNQELARYAYVASHDLQEPVRKNMLLADMIIDKYYAHIPEEAQDLLRRLKNSAERMQLVIRDLLTYSRLNSGPVLLNEKVELSKLIQLATSNLEYMISEKGATILAPGSQVLTGNALQLLLLFQNLLANAIKFTAPDVKPVVSIVAELLTKEQSGPINLPGTQQWLCIQVIDNGIGFDEQYTDRIFEVFQRLHSKNDFSGTGIGLSICKKIIDLHGGKITAKSSPGRGSNFTVYLPA